MGELDSLVGSFVEFSVVWNRNGPKASSPMRLLPDDFENRVKIACALDEARLTHQKEIKKASREQQKLSSAWAAHKRAQKQASAGGKSCGKPVAIKGGKGSGKRKGR